MSSKTLIGGIVVLAVLALGIWYISSSNVGTSPTDGTATTSDTTTGTTDGNTSGTTANPNTFRSIFTQEGNNQCTYEQVEASSRSTNVIYIADGKMRGEFRTMTGNDTASSLMIYDGGFLYSWQEGQTTGKKTSLKSIADLPEAIPADISSGAIFGKSLDNVSWDCRSWAKDAKVFVIPTYVKFL